MAGFGGFGTANQGGLFSANKSPGTGFGGLGTPAATTIGLTFGTNTFGAASTPASGLFGATTQPAATGFQFGAPTATTTTPSNFGIATPTFGTATPSFGTAAPTLGGFGATTSATAPTALTFGTAAPNLNFGTPNTTASSTLTYGTTPSFGFGATATTTTSAFNFTTTATATPAFNFGPTATTTTATGLSFGLTPATSQTPATGGLMFPGKTPASVAPSLSFAMPATTTPAFNFAGTTPSLFGAKPTEVASLTTSTTTTTIGLGGVDNSQAKPGLSGPGQTEPKHVKDNLLPEPLMQTLTEFQAFTKQQKSISVEISHGSTKPLKKVTEDTEALEALLATINNGLTRNTIAVDKLKAETAQGLHQAEMAQRMHEIPPGLEYDNCAPAEYFETLVTRFETDARRLRSQMEAAEKHLKSLTQGATISPQELTLTMRRLHETLVVLAARVQTQHTSVESQKELYRNVRRIYLKDDSVVFEKDVESERKKQIMYSLRSLTGPTPFSDSPGPNLSKDGLAVLTKSAAASLNYTNISVNAGWMTSPQNSTLASSASLLSSPPTVDSSSSFPLAKPPVGNKRNKR